MRVWFNKTFSSLHTALRLIREGDVACNYEILTSSPNSHAIVQLASHEFHSEPAKLIGADYVNWCEKFSIEHNVDIFIPGKEAALFADEQERFANQGIRIMSCSTREYLDKINDKKLFYELVNCDNARSPETFPCNTLKEFDFAFAELRKRHHSVCIKPATSVFGIGFRRIRTDCSAYDLFCAGNNYQIDLLSLRFMLSSQERFSTLLVMEYIDGPEFSVDCIADQGVMKLAVARRKPVSVGEGQAIDAREDIQSACKSIVSQFFLNGYANIQFREGDRGLHILEVNPRMSGGIGMACMSGANLPYLGLVGFDSGYASINIPSVAAGLRVVEYNQAAVLPC